jgi:hypothetical protein
MLDPSVDAENARAEAVCGLFQHWVELRSLYLAAATR